MSDAATLHAAISTIDWQPASLPGSYIDAWRQLHYAAQIVSEIGKSWSAPQPDDSHTNLGWFGSPSEGGFESVLSKTTPHFKARLHAQNLNLDLVTDGEGVVKTLALTGKTLADGLAWIETEASQIGGPRLQPSVPAPDLPDHPIANGATFDCQDSASFNGLARLYANTDAMLQALRQNLPNASDARTWPHHFDHALLSVVTTDDTGAMTATIGIGITPPDGLNSTGYWYVSPWQKQSATDGLNWDELPVGAWIDREGSVPMALLPVTDVAGKNEQHDAVSQFIAQATAICLRNLKQES